MLNSRRMLGRRRFLALTAGAALAEVLTRGRALVQAQEQNLMVTMSSHNLDSTTAWIAQDLHFFEKYGLNVQVISVQGGARMVAPMLAAGEVPIAFIGAAEIVSARAKGIPVKMIAGLNTKIPYDFVVAKDITSPSQLKGAKGAVAGFGGSSDVIIRFALTKLGVNPNEVTLLQIGNEISRLAALASGQIQFTVLTAGLDLVAFDMGFKPFLKLYTVDQPYQHSGIAVNTTWAAHHAAVILSFLKAIIASSVYIKNPAHEAAVLAVLRRHLQIKESHLRQGFQLYRDHFFTIYPLVTEPGMEFILKAKKIDQPVSDFYDNSYVQALQDVDFATAAAKSL